MEFGNTRHRVLVKSKPKREITHLVIFCSLFVPVKVRGSLSNLNPETLDKILAGWVTDPALRSVADWPKESIIPINPPKEVLPRLVQKWKDGTVGFVKTDLLSKIIGIPDKVAEKLTAESGQTTDAWDKDITQVSIDCLLIFCIESPALASVCNGTCCKLIL